MRTNSEFLAMNGPGKHVEGHRPNLQDDINVLRDRIARLLKKMRPIGNRLRHKDTVNIEDLEVYQDLNEKLLAAKIAEAHAVYARNIL
jgi:hypothetical protein